MFERFMDGNGNGLKSMYNSGFFQGARSRK